MKRGGCGSGGSGGNWTGGGKGGSKAVGAIAGTRQSISTVEVANWEDGNNTAGGLSDYFFINTYSLIIKNNMVKNCIYFYFLRLLVLLDQS